MLVNEKVSRKIDNTGRVSIPKHLRLKFNCNEGQEVALYTLEDGGETYICIKPILNKFEDQ